MTNSAKNSACDYIGMQLKKKFEKEFLKSFLKMDFFVPILRKIRAISYNA